MGDDAAIALQLHLSLNGRSRRGCRQEQDTDSGLEMESGDTKAVELSSKLCDTSPVHVAPRTIHRPQNRAQSSSVYSPGIQKVKQLGRMARAATQQQLGRTDPHQLPAAPATSHAAPTYAVQLTPTLLAQGSAWHECKRGEQVLPACRCRLSLFDPVPCCRTKPSALSSLAILYWSILPHMGTSYIETWQL